MDTDTTTFNKSNTDKKKRIILKIIGGPDTGKEFRIDINGYFQSFILGRDAFGSQALFKLKNIDRYVSRNHCIFEVLGYSDNNTVYLIDNNSLNGTWIYRKGIMGFKRIKSKVKLEDKDIILIGNTSIIIRANND